MTDMTQRKAPEVFERLVNLQCLSMAEIFSTSDGFYLSAVSVADILARRGITNVPNSRGVLLECCLFFDDWYLYAVSDHDLCTYGLYKMREQEYDAELGKHGDGDTPGVTISFVSLQPNVLLDCLCAPTSENRALLNEEINRVVAYKGQRHNEMLKLYFLRTQAQGAYSIAKLYTNYIASLAVEGSLPVPKRYADNYKRQGIRGRVPRFLEQNNENAGRVICDHEKLYIADTLAPTDQERLAILATHTGNTSVFSFAAEVQFHARFLTWWAKIPIPIIGSSPYASAIRADMSIGDAEFIGPTPYYRANSRLVRQQFTCHNDKHIL